MAALRGLAARAPARRRRDDARDAEPRRHPGDRRVHRQVPPDRGRGRRRLHVAGHRHRDRVDDLARLLPAGRRRDVARRGAAGARHARARPADGPRGARRRRPGRRGAAARGGWETQLVAVVMGAAILVVGIMPQPLFDLVEDGAQGIIPGPLLVGRRPPSAARSACSEAGSGRLCAVRITAKADYAVRAAAELAAAEGEGPRQGRADRLGPGHPAEVPGEHPQRAADGRHRRQPPRRRRRLLARPAGRRDHGRRRPARRRGAARVDPRHRPRAPGLPGRRRARCRACGSRCARTCAGCSRA